MGYDSDNLASVSGKRKRKLLFDLKKKENRRLKSFQRLHEKLNQSRISKTLSRIRLRRARVVTVGKITLFTRTVKLTKFIWKYWCHSSVIPFEEAASECSQFKKQHDRDLSKQFWCPLYGTKNSILDWVLKLNLRVTKYGGNDGTVNPSFPHFLNKMDDPLLPYFHYFFLMFTIALA